MDALYLLHGLFIIKRHRDAVVKTYIFGFDTRSITETRRFDVIEGFV
jgi:hypothetical protein